MADLYLLLLTLPMLALALVAFVLLPPGWLLAALVPFAAVSAFFEVRSKALYQGATGEEHPRHYEPRHWALSANGVSQVSIRVGVPPTTHVVWLRTAQVVAASLFVLAVYLVHAGNR